jgi:hypothetical protein
MDVKTRKLYQGEHVSAEAYDAQPMTKPIYFRNYYKGSYVSVAEARLLRDELTRAIDAVDDDGKTTRSVR